MPPSAVCPIPESARLPWAPLQRWSPMRGRYSLAFVCTGNCVEISRPEYAQAGPITGWNHGLKEELASNGAPVHEFLYRRHNAGPDNSSNWGRVGIVNGALLSPDDLEH